MTIGEAFTALGYVVGAVVLVWAAAQKRLATEGMAWLAIAGLAGGIAGAKLTELIFEGWPLKVPFVAGLDPRAGGRALLGGLILGWIAVEIAKRRLGIRRSTGDLFALALPAGEAVGRIGCFFNTCCYGTVCNAPWAVYQHGAWRHPTQIYSALSAGFTFLTLLIVSRSRQYGDPWGRNAVRIPLPSGGEGLRVLRATVRGRLRTALNLKRSESLSGPQNNAMAPSEGPSPPAQDLGPKTQHLVRREGDLFKLYLILFGATRFGLEFIRQNDMFWVGLTPMQWFCLELVVFGTFTLAVRRNAATAQ